VELSLKLPEPAGLLPLELFEMLCESGLGSLDLLLEPIGAFLQVTPDVTH
jgi:hypothetical protein